MAGFAGVDDGRQLLADIGAGCRFGYAGKATGLIGQLIDEAIEAGPLAPDRIECCRAQTVAGRRALGKKLEKILGVALNDQLWRFPLVAGVAAR